MDTSDEIPLEDHRYFRARLDYLESRHPAALLSHLEQGTLTEHLREVTGRAMQAKGELVFNQKLPEDQADELVMNQLVADPQELSRLTDRVHPDDPANQKVLRNSALLLQVCSHIANGAKHFKATARHHRSVSDTKVKPGAFSADFSKDFDTERLVVELQGDAATALGPVIDVLTLAVQVRDYWMAKLGL